MRLKQPSRRIVFIALILLTAYFIIMPRHWTAPPRALLISLVSPVQKQATNGARFLGKMWSDLSARRNLADENRSLQDRILLLENTLVRMKNDIIQAQEKMRSFDALSKLPMEERLHGVDANVIAVDSSNWRSSIEIDQGTSGGVAPGQAVVWNDAVVGVVLHAGEWASRVLLLVDPECRIAAYDVRSREHGIIEGTGYGLCRMKHVPRDRDVRAGDLIVTSAIGGTFPASLLVGQVVESKAPESGLFREIYVQPRVQFSRLESVMVLQKPPPRERASEPNKPKAQRAKTAP